MHAIAEQLRKISVPDCRITRDADAQTAQTQTKMRIPIITVLVATDLSGRSDIAVARAVLIAQQQDATLHVLHVVDGELPLTLAEAQCEAAEYII